MFKIVCYIFAINSANKKTGKNDKTIYLKACVLNFDKKKTVEISMAIMPKTKQ